MKRVALVLLGVAVLAACAPPTASQQPSTSIPAATNGAALASDLPGPSEGPPGAVPLFVPGDAMTVTVGPVDVFDEANGSSKRMGNLDAGDVVQLLDFAKVEDDRVWLYVLDLSSPVRGRLPDLPEIVPDPEFGLSGWILAGDATGARVRFLQPRCPQEADFATIVSMLSFERLACFGRRSFTLEGIAGCGPCGADEGVYEPPWLAGDAGGSIFPPSGGPRSFGLYIPPPLGFPEGGTLIRVTGHFDDPASATCSVTLDGVQLPRAETVEMCRRKFVVEALQVLPMPTPNPLE